TATNDELSEAKHKGELAADRSFGKPATQTTTQPSANVPSLFVKDKLPYPAPRIRAVFFDIGGVVFDSPVSRIVEYEHRIGLHRFELNQLMGGSKHFHDLECGHITL